MAPEPTENPQTFGVINATFLAERKTIEEAAKENMSYYDSSICALVAAKNTLEKGVDPNQGGWQSWVFSKWDPLWNPLSIVPRALLSASKIAITDNTPINTDSKGDKTYLTSWAERQAIYHQKTNDVAGAATYLLIGALSALLLKKPKDALEETLQKSAKELVHKTLQPFDENAATNPINKFKLDLGNPLSSYNPTKGTDDARAGLAQAREAIKGQQLENETALTALTDSFNTKMKALYDRHTPKIPASSSASPFLLKTLHQLHLHVNAQMSDTINEQLKNSSDLFDAAIALADNKFSDANKTTDLETLTAKYPVDASGKDKIKHLYTNAKNLYEGLNKAGPLEPAKAVSVEGAKTDEPVVSVSGSDIPSPTPSATSAQGTDIKKQLEDLKTSEAARIKKSVETFNNDLSDLRAQQHKSLTDQAMAAIMIKGLQNHQQQIAKNEFIAQQSIAESAELRGGASDKYSKLDTVQALGKVIHGSTPKGIQALGWQINFTPSDPNSKTSLKGSYNLSFQHHSRFNKQEGIKQQAALIGFTSDTIKFTAKASTRIRGVPHVDRKAVAEMVGMQIDAIYKTSSLDPSKASIKFLIGFDKNNEEVFKTVKVADIEKYQLEGGEDPCLSKDIGGNTISSMQMFFPGKDAHPNVTTRQSRKNTSKMTRTILERYEHDKLSGRFEAIKDTYDDVMKDAEKAAANPAATATGGGGGGGGGGGPAHLATVGGAH